MTHNCLCSITMLMNQESGMSGNLGWSFNVPCICHVMQIYLYLTSPFIRLPLDPELHVDMLGSVYVNTVDTVSMKCQQHFFPALEVIYYFIYLCFILILSNRIVWKSCLSWPLNQGDTHWLLDLMDLERLPYTDIFCRDEVTNLK